MVELDPQCTVIALYHRRLPLALLPEDGSFSATVFQRIGASRNRPETCLSSGR
jgi:hypothetical protein